MDAACPVSTGGGTRRVRLVRGRGGGASPPGRSAAHSAAAARAASRIAAACAAQDLDHHNGHCWRADNDGNSMQPHREATREGGGRSPAASGCAPPSGGRRDVCSLRVAHRALRGPARPRRPTRGASGAPAAPRCSASLSAPAAAPPPRARTAPAASLFARPPPARRPAPSARRSTRAVRACGSRRARGGSRGGRAPPLPAGRHNDQFTKRRNRPFTTTITAPREGRGWDGGLGKTCTAPAFPEKSPAKPCAARCGAKYSRYARASSSCRRGSAKWLREEREGEHERPLTSATG